MSRKGICGLITGSSCFNCSNRYREKAGLLPEDYQVIGITLAQQVLKQSLLGM